MKQKKKKKRQKVWDQEFKIFRPFTVHTKFGTVTSKIVADTFLILTLFFLYFSEKIRHEKHEMSSHSFLKQKNNQMSCAAVVWPSKRVKSIVIKRSCTTVYVLKF